MKTNQTIAVLAIASATLLAGCGAPHPNDNYPPSYPVSTAPAYNAAYGVVDSIQIVQQNTGSNGVGGAVVAVESRG